MGFVKTMDEISANHRETGDFYDAEVLTVYFETKPEIIQALLTAASNSRSLADRCSFL